MYKKTLAEIKNALGHQHVSDVSSGVVLGLWRSNISEIPENGGMLDVEYKLEYNPDGKRPYVDSIHLRVNLDREMLKSLEKRAGTPEVCMCLRLRNTWPTPTLEIEQYQDLDIAIGSKDFVGRLHWSALKFAQNHHRTIISTLINSGFFDATDWSGVVAADFRSRMQVA